MSLIGKVFKPLVKTVLVLLGLTAAASGTDRATQKNIVRSGTTLIISDEEVNDIKVVKSL